jgi:transcription elongation factor Elf1
LVNQGNVTTYDGEIPSSRERRRIVDESGRDAVLFDVSASEIGKIKIWDCVDGTWTEPLEKGLAMEHYLRKLIYKCSCCIDASLFEADIKKHLTQLKLSYEIHKDAQLERGLGDSGVMTVMCSGCGSSFSMRKNQGQRHIDRIKEDYESHVEVGSINVLLMHRYVMSPSVSMPEQIVDTVEFGNRNTEVHKNTRSDVKAEIKPKRHRRRRKR